MLSDIAYAMAPAQGQGGGQGSAMSFIIMIAMLFAIFYFFMIRPQQKRAKEQKHFLENLRKGDRVITTGGLHGTVVSLADTVVTLEVADKVKVKVGRSYIAGLMKSE